MNRTRPRPRLKGGRLCHYPCRPATILRFEKSGPIRREHHTTGDATHPTEDEDDDEDEYDSRCRPPPSSFSRAGARLKNSALTFN